MGLPAAAPVLDAGAVPLPQEAERRGIAFSGNPRRGSWALLAALLAVLTIAAYLPALGNGFIWDDDFYVTANAAVQSIDGLSRIWFKPGSVPQYYPLTFTTFWIEYRLWGLAPFGYHCVNVLLHALNALLFWQVLRRLGVPGAWVAAAVFAVHPIQVESVAWITERKNVLSGACYFGAALTYLRFSSPEFASTARWRWYASAIGLFCGALLSKSVTCSLPAALLLVLWWKRDGIGWRDVVPLLPFFALGLAAAAMTVVMERQHVGARGPEWAFSTVEHALIAGRVLWFYLWTLLWPRNLTFMYPRWQIDAGVWWQYVFPLAALTLVAALIALRRRLGKGPLVAALLYAGTLVPALGFFNVYPMRYSFVADHFSYLANLGPIALGTALVVRLLERLRVGQNTRHALASGILVVLGMLTWQQARVYRDLGTLWTDTVAKNPAGSLGHLNLGALLAQQGQIDEAFTHIETGLQLWPASPEAHNALGAMLDEQGEYDAARAEFEAALRLAGRHYEAHTNLAMVLTSQGEFERAIDHLNIAIRLSPRFAEAYYQAATTLVAMGAPIEAAKYFAKTLLLAPEHAEAHNGLCALQVDQGRPADAMAHCNEALRLKSDYPEAHENLARALRLQGRLPDALAHEETARRLRKELAEGNRRQGVLLAEQGRPKAAIAHFREALRLLPDDPATQAHLQQLRARER